MKRSTVGFVELLLLISTASAMAMDYHRVVEVRSLDDRATLHDRIVSGRAEAPYRYRLLVPYAVESMSRAGTALIGRRASLSASYVLFDFAAILATLVSLLAFGRIWFTKWAALAGTFYTASVMHVALRNHYYQPWSLLEPALFTAGLLIMSANVQERSKRWSLAIVTAVAVLNRETGLLVPLCATVWNCSRASSKEDRRASGVARALRETAPSWVIAAAVLAGVRLLQGDAPMGDVAARFARNVEPDRLRLTVSNLWAFFGFGWIVAAKGYRDAPALVRVISSVAIPVLTAFVAVFGMWYEVRLLMPLYPLLTVLMLSGMAAPPEREAESLEAET